MKLAPLDLKPTQFAVGMREVRKKVQKIKELDQNDLHRFLHEKPVPVVRSGRGEFFIIDHHHFVRACWEAGIPEVHAEQKADFSHLKNAEFWKVLTESRWSHLYDQFGEGPREPRLLPEDVRGLADDPYRSLAWELRREGGYEKSDEPFLEFHWAQFLRQRIVLEPGSEGFKRALKAALDAARSPDGKKLRGDLKPPQQRGT